MTIARLVVLLAACVVWMIPFFRAGKPVAAQRVDKRARWGIVLQGVGFAFVWSQPFWTRDLAMWRWFAALPFLALAPLLSWTSTQALGRQWRLDAGLNADHELIRRGAYRFVRHPIYASMFAAMLGTGLLITRLRFVAIAVVFFVIGTEIRVRIEERLLASRFDAEFAEYRRRVSAYIPFVR